MKLSPHEVAFVACWYWLGPDPTTWGTVLPPYEKVKAVLSDTTKWAALASPQALVLRDAVAVPLRESDGDTDALHRSASGPSLGNYDHGLYQISGRWQFDKLKATPDWRDPYVNAAMARKVYDQNGGKWEPWSVFTSGAYKERWPDAQIALNAPIPPAELPLPGEYTDGAKLDEILDRGASLPPGLADDLNTIAGLLRDIRSKFS